ncbi:response regulator [Pedobacter sp.]|uniref:response regulator n=1 Tax=Pedobacter sp. TaxID=1411316 RepID=UPI0031D0DE5D
MVKLLLILAIIGGGISLFSYNKENTAYFKQKQHLVDQLVSLSNLLHSAHYAYINLIGADSAQADSLSNYLNTLGKEKGILEVLSQGGESNKAEANVALTSLESELRFYSGQLAQNGNVLDVGEAGRKMGATQPLLDKLIKQEREELKVRISQNDGFYENLGFLVVSVGLLVLIMNIVLYFRSKKSLQKQMAHAKEIHNAKLAAQSANNAKSEYLAMISHEIRTPMNGVLGMSNLLMQGSLNEEQKEYAKTIHHSAESLLRIVNDVLDFSRIEAGKIQLDKTTTNIRELIAQTFAILPKKSSEQLKIEYWVDESVPQFVYIDQIRLKQVLLNFLGNAVKFTAQGSITLECKVIDTDETGFMRLGFIVKDTGIGIAEDRIKLLFKPFVQVDHTTVRKYGGTGLGLNIAYNLISMMEGKVKVDSVVGKGSIFTFFIVTKEMSGGQKAKSNDDKQPILDVALSTLYPLNILVVDDNEINLMLITKTLSKLGYECKKASNGQLAVDLVKQNEFDLIFMDMQMPIMDGTVATTEIRKHYRVYEYPVVIALTANALGDGKDKCLEAGMQDFIAKPFKPAEIEEVIRKWAPKIVKYKDKTQSIFLS